MSDIKYNVTADASKAKAVIDAQMREASKLGTRHLDDLVARYNRLNVAQRAYEQRLAKTEARGRGAFGEVGAGVEGVDTRVRSLSDRYREVTRQTQIWMRLSTVAAGAVAGAFSVALKSAASYEKQFTAINSATAATRRAMRELRQDFGSEMYTAVRGADPYVSSVVSVAGEVRQMFVQMAAGAMRGDPAEQARARQAELADRAAAMDAVRINNVGNINKMFDAQRARIAGDEVKAFEIEGRMRLQQQNVKESARLVAGEISDQEFVAIVDGSKQIFELELQSMKDRIEKEARELDFRKHEDELEIYLEGMRLLREIDADAARKLEEHNQEVQRKHEQAVRAQDNFDRSMESFEIDTDLESAAASEARLRRMGMDEEADRVRVEAIYEAERRRTKSAMGRVADDALDADLPIDQRERIYDRTMELMQQRLRALDEQEAEALLSLGEDRKERRRDRDQGIGLVVGSGVGSDIANRVFGMPTGAQRETEKQTRKLEEIGDTLNQIKENTGRAMVGTWA